MLENTDLFNSVIDDTLAFEYATPTEADMIPPDIDLEITVTPEKSFNACLLCKYFRNGCSGPDLAVATPERACEFLHDVFILRKLTYAFLARESGLAVSTVRRILSGQEKNPSFYAIHRLCVVLVGDPNGKFPCALHIVAAETAEIIEECKSAKEALAAYETRSSTNREEIRTQLDDMKTLIKFRGEQLREKDKLLTERGNFLRRKDTAIKVLSVCLGASVLAFITTLILWISVLT